MGKTEAKLSRKDKGTAVEKRIVLLNQERCKPKSPAWNFLRRHAGKCGKECIFITGKKFTISEELCGACLITVKKCPGDACKVVKLPTNLDKDTTHRYGVNAFKLHHLVMPRPGQVLGLLGSNGIGKSTVMDIMSGKTKPNLGNLESPPVWADILSYYRGSELQNYFKRMLTDDDFHVASKPQQLQGAEWNEGVKGLTVGKVLGVTTPDGKTVEHINPINHEDRRHKDWVLETLELVHLIPRAVMALSGGELQRLAVAHTALEQADVYVFDEPCSFLDIKQRLAVTDVIRSLIDPSIGPGRDGPSTKGTTSTSALGAVEMHKEGIKEANKAQEKLVEAQKVAPKKKRILTEAHLRAFYKVHCPDKEDRIPEMMQKFTQREIMGNLKKKYNSVPVLVVEAVEGEEKDETSIFALAAAKDTAPVDVSLPTMRDDEAITKRYVMVVEHDLAILGYVSDAGN
jgi:ABC-type Mn2+/Zn2+ transport system ATPase subunit